MGKFDRKIEQKVCKEIGKNIVVELTKVNKNFEFGKPEEIFTLRWIY